MPIPFQTTQQRIGTKIFLKIKGIGGVLPVNFWNRQAGLFEMFTKINKGLGFFLMLIIGGNGSAPLVVNTKIDPVAAALLNFFNSFTRFGCRS